MSDKHAINIAVLEEAIEQLPKVTYPKYMRVSRADYYRLMKAVSNINSTFPPPIWAYMRSPIHGLCGELIFPDDAIKDGQFEVDW